MSTLQGTSFFLREGASSRIAKRIVFDVLRNRCPGVGGSIVERGLSCVKTRLFERGRGGGAIPGSFRAHNPKINK
jgi:hypothetical protein